MIVQQNNVFIDPDNCGSSIGYYITTSEHKPKDKPPFYLTDAIVVIANCAHKIDWSFGGEGAIEKVDAAIHMLQEFRKKYVEVKKMVAKLNK